MMAGSWTLPDTPAPIKIGLAHCWICAEANSTRPGKRGHIFEAVALPLPRMMTDPMTMAIGRPTPMDRGEMIKELQLADASTFVMRPKWRFWVMEVVLP